ncbi:MAG: anti-sigma factor RsbA family regulatory protein [Actinomycetota bacterium]
MIQRDHGQPGPASSGAFSHHALFYSGLNDLVEQAVPYLREGIQQDERILVLAPPNRLEALRDGLGGDSRQVQFQDMTKAGRNPSAIISTWRDFISSGEGPVRGIGEPAWFGRSPEELLECHRHEALINLAFADDQGTILCPYDASALPAAELEKARTTHPTVLEQGIPAPIRSFEGAGAALRILDAPLSPVPADALRFEFGADGLSEVRAAALRFGMDCGLKPMQVDCFVLAASELLTNSLKHGGGRGQLLLWRADGSVVGQVDDPGFIADPLIGRQRAELNGGGGLGLWMVNQLVDLMQLRTGTAGTSVRFSLRVAR